MASRAISLAIVCATFAVAHAQSTHATALAEFDKGRALLKQGKFEEACDAFNASQKLEAANGTLFNIAECSERVGKLATAWLAFRELGRDDTNAGRKQESARRAKSLEKRLPKLLVRIDDAPAGLTVTINDRDSTALVGIENPIDQGTYTIRATAPDHEPFETKVSVTAEGKTVKVSIELEMKPDMPRPPKKKKRREPVAASNRTRNGVLVGASGGVVLVVGAVFGLRARSAWSDAEALCPARACASGPDKVRGDELVADARSSARTSTLLVLGGAAISAAGIYLIVTGRRSDARTAIHLAPARDGAAVVFGGRF